MLGAATGRAKVYRPSFQHLLHFCRFLPSVVSWHLCHLLAQVITDFEDLVQNKISIEADDIIFTAKTANCGWRLWPASGDSVVMVSFCSCCRLEPVFDEPSGNCDPRGQRNSTPDAHRPRAAPACHLRRARLDAADEEVQVGRWRLCSTSPVPDALAADAVGKSLRLMGCPRTFTLVRHPKFPPKHDWFVFSLS